MKKPLLASVLLLVLLLSVYVHRQLNTPYHGYSGNIVIDIPQGLKAREVIGLLNEKQILPDRYLSLTYVFLTRNRSRLQAGEYLFDRPMTPAEVIDKLVRGDVVLHKFTVPEGLTVDEVGREWEEQGFGKAEDFLIARAPAPAAIRDLDAEVSSVEGYLFPETYSLPKGTTADDALVAMFERFRAVLERLEKEVPRSEWPLDLRQTVILASLVEKETAVEEERPLVASVFLNRLRRRMRLDCDPTVIYALERAGRYRGILTEKDLRYPSPYNTYLHSGLPPGPIANPGYASLKAAVQPAATRYLYFVSTNAGRHAFSETLSLHNRAVARYRQKAKLNRRSIFQEDRSEP